MKIDRLEIKQKSPEEYGIIDHKTDVFIVVLHTKDYTNCSNILEEMKAVIDEAMDNGDLHL